MTSNENETLSQAVASAVAAVAADGRVRGIWLFGSAHQGRLWEDSDVDLLVVAEGVAAHEQWAAWQETLFHLHWYPPAALASASGVVQAQRAAGSGRRLYPAPSENGAGELAPFDPSERRTHLLPHLEAMAGWARDLRQRMALGDERPRRAAARQWVVDNHAASVLLIEAGRYPGAEPSRQALDARIFVPTMLDPDEIEAFVRARLDEWVAPLWRAAGTPFDAGALKVGSDSEIYPRLLEQAAAVGLLRVVYETAGAGQPLGRRLYQPHDSR